ncbi:dihydrofolate reductase [Paenibacillus sp. NPDC056579]|uniref:dihydrofolate reductase n=1 Tax=Paenibacillus sp. NPDC056579 TaxID=3345871 RepID=UPI003684DD4A
MIISLIAAVDKNNVIGQDKDIPWTIPGEQRRFKELTLGRTIIMGRKTYDSIGKPLPGRNTIVVSRSHHIEAERCTTVTSLQDALQTVQEENEVFIAGGGQLYAEALPYADKIYLTVIDHEFEGNIYFPAFDWQQFDVTYEQRVETSLYPYTYYTLERKQEK